MVIGYDASRAFTKERTGTENYSYQLLKALAKIDKKNRYVVHLRPPLRINVTAVELIRQFPKNFQFVTIPWPRFWTQGGLAFQTFKDKLDVLFVPAHTLPVVIKPGLKTVMTVHDLGAEYLPKLHQLKQRLYLRWITRYQLASATRLIAVSKATKEDLIKKIGISPNKIEVVYEGYDMEKFKTSKLPLAEQMSDVKSDRLVNGLIPYYLFVGTVQPRKNLERIITAFSRVILRTKSEESLANASTTETSSEILRYAQSDNLKLVIAGSKGWLSEDIYKLPKKLGIESRVKFLGYVPDEQMPALYPGAKALVFPSLFEGFGLPILEAQASGCPVLTSNISSMPEVAGKGALLVDPYSVDDIVLGLEKMEDRKLRMEIIKEGFENIKRFSWRKCAEEILRVLTSS